MGGGTFADFVVGQDQKAEGLGVWSCGKAAQNYAAKILKAGSSTIRLTGKQSYGRPIGTVEVDGEDLGERMIAAGLAVPATRYLKADPARAQRYVPAYDRAKARRAGVHAGYSIDPAKWRRGERLYALGRLMSFGFERDARESGIVTLGKEQSTLIETVSQLPLADRSGPSGGQSFCRFDRG